MLFRNRSKRFKKIVGCFFVSGWVWTRFVFFWCVFVCLTCKCFVLHLFQWVFNFIIAWNFQANGYPRCILCSIIFSDKKILMIPVISNEINWCRGTFFDRNYRAAPKAPFCRCLWLRSHCYSARSPGVTQGHFVVELLECRLGCQELWSRQPHA